MHKNIILALSFILLTPNVSLAVDPVTTTCDDNLPIPVVEATLNESNILLSWDQIDHTNLSGYKLVISKGDSTPSYPDNGYLKYITNRETTSYTINNSTVYNGGDITGSYLEEDEDYYFTVTAVYGCGQKVTGNILHLTYPGDSVATSTPQVSAEVGDNDIVLSWAKITDASFSGYKLVISKGDSTPSYPDNGYLKYITNRETTSYTINNSTVYNGGDITGSYLEEDEDYYFTVTAVYGCGQRVTGNVLHLTYPGVSVSDDTDEDVNDDSDDTTAVNYPVPEVTATSSTNGVLLSWKKINHDDFTGYKVVISRDKNKPKYPDHGYARYITDPNTTSILLNNGSEYVRGDFGGYLQTGQIYYFSITALYGDERVAGNAVLSTYNGPSHQIKTKPTVDSLTIIREKAQQLLDNNLGDILDELQELRSKLREQENEIKYLRSLLSDVRSITQSVKDTLNQFI